MQFRNASNLKQKVMTSIPDGSLKEVDVLVDPEVELLCHPVPGLCVLLLEVHDEHGVERVDDGQAESEPVLASLGDRTQVVVAPGKASIGAPSMLKSIKDQVWSLTQFYSDDFSKSRIGVSKCSFNKRTIKVCVSCF